MNSPALQSPFDQGMAMDGTLVARTSSIAAIRTQPAACHGDEMPCCRRT